MRKTKIIDSAVQFPDHSVSCPICNQEFWGYSEIIYCKCGWTYVKGEVPKPRMTSMRMPETLSEPTSSHLHGHVEEALPRKKPRSRPRLPQKEVSGPIYLFPEKTDH